MIYTCIRFLKATTDRSCEIRLKRKDGSEFYAQLENIAVNDVIGNSLCRTSVIDITDRKEAEKALGKTLDNLKLLNIELQQITFGIAHDLLNPVNIIAGCMYLFEENYKGKMGTQFDELLKYASFEFHNINNFIQDLLTYAQIGTKIQAPGSVDLSLVVDKATTNLQHEITESGAVVIYDNLPVVVSSEVEMIRLFQNLISNAIKYRRKKPQKIHISAERKERELLVSVQ